PLLPLGGQGGGGWASGGCLGDGQLGPVPVTRADGLADPPGDAAALTMPAPPPDGNSTAAGATRPIHPGEPARPGSRASRGTERGFEQLNHVPGRVLDQDLLPARAGDDLV